MPCGPSCRGRSQLPLEDPRFAGGRTASVPTSSHRQGRGLELLYSHLRDQPLDLALLEHARPEVLGRLGPAGDRETEAVVHLARAVAGGHEAGEERVAGPDGRDRLERLERRAVEAAAPRGVEQHGEAPVGQCHDRLAGTELDHLADPGAAVVLVGELVAHQALCLQLVRGDDVRALAGGDVHRLALGVEHRHDAEALHLLDQAAVEPRVDAAREAAGDDADRGALRQVEQLVDEQLELGLGHVWAVLVDLGLLAAGRIHDGGRGARFLPDPHEVVEYPLLGEVLDDARPGGPAGHAGRNDRLSERAQCARHVDALAAGHGGLVDGGVECDGDDHLAMRIRMRRRRMARIAATRIPRTMSTVRGTPSSDTTTRRVPAPGTSAAVTRATRRTGLPSTTTVTEPTRSPAASGPSSSSGAFTLRRSCWPWRVVRKTSRRGTSRAFSSRYSMSARASARPLSTILTRLKRARPQRRSVSVSTSRAASVGSPRTALTTRARGPRAAAPTSTFPAFRV